MIDRIRKWLKRTERKIALSKREEFVIVTIILTLGLVLSQLMSLEWRYPMVVLLSLVAYAGSAIALREDLKGVEWLTLLVLPTLFTAAVGLFYFLLPVRWATRLPVAAAYGVGMYALLLTENIYNVAAQRGIGLLRAAHSVGFLLSLVTYFLLLSTTLSFRLPVFFNAVVIGIVSFFLVLQSVWSYELTPIISKRVGEVVLATSLVFFEFTWVLYFWPMKPILVALLLTTGFYSFVGIAQQYIVEKLYKRTIVEFLAVFVIVFLLGMMTTHWRGPV
ncbi:hypothetical protein HY086_04365 [Candidatus Gottesmanbacteria bacterium]|nr:hypothetical protein [Candidatus Gottesmanbacteria bacterium]